MINKIPGIEFDKFEMSPLSTDLPEKPKIKQEGGDASVAEQFYATQPTAEGDAIRRKHDIQARVGSMTTVAQSQTASYDFLDDGGEYAAQMELNDKIRAQKLETLLQNTLQNQELAANAELSKPIIMANSTKQGDNINQTQISAGELSTDHSDLTAKHLSDSISA